MTTRLVTQCRVCGSPDLLPYLDLGPQPLANRLLRSPTERAPRYPLTVQACTRCTLSQLTHVVDAAELFDESYVYQSGRSAGWHRHCADLAVEIAVAGMFAIDIGSNDGTMLRYLQQCGMDILGVDPAASQDSDAPPALNEFWSADLVLRANLKADRIIAQNVLGHVDDVHDFMNGIRLALRPNGYAVIEVPDLEFLMSTVAFDTVYHEHHSYWSRESLHALVTMHDLVILQIHWLPKIHGGSIRMTIGHPSTERGPGFTDESANSQLHDPEHYREFTKVVCRTIATIDDELRALPAFYGFTAPAKATVLLNSISARPRAIFDDTPAKWSCYVPGTGVEIRQSTNLGAIERLVAFAWNWLPEIQRRIHALGFRGKLFVPLPRPHWIEP